MTIGELDRRVVIENVSVSRNSYGELDRNLDMSNLSLQSRLTYDSKYYFPKIINQIDGRTAFLEIICENKD